MSAPNLGWPEVVVESPFPSLLPLVGIAVTIQEAGRAGSCQEPTPRPSRCRSGVRRKSANASASTLEIETAQTAWSSFQIEKRT